MYCRGKIVVSSLLLSNVRHPQHPDTRNRGDKTPTVVKSLVSEIDTCVHRT